MSEFTKFKRSEIRIAKELRYGLDTILRLQSATTESEIARIMKTAREKMEE